MKKQVMHEISTKSLLNLMDIVDTQIKWMDFIIEARDTGYGDIERATRAKNTLITLKKSIRDDL